nr:FAD-dependent oxidoreductase [Rhodococcus sp. MTM3W5.2]
MEQVDVVVVGGGPTGLTIAGDLSRAGREVAVLERWPQINPSSRAFATMARTLEVLDSRNLAEDLLELGTTIAEVHLFADATLDLARLPSRYRYALITPRPMWTRPSCGTPASRVPRFTVAPKSLAW